MSSSTHRIAAPLFAPETGSDVFHVAVKPEMDNEAAVQSRCWFACVLHVLAHDEAIFTLSQEAVLLLDAMGASVAHAFHATADFALGSRMAYLVQQARCPSLVPPGDHTLFVDTLMRALAHAGATHEAQSFLEMYGVLRPVLLRACAQLIPSSRETFRDPAVAYSGSFHLESDLATPQLLSSSPEWIMVERTQVGVGVAYNPDRVRVGRSAVYAVVCVVQFAGDHFAVWADGRMLNSHGGSMPTPEDIPGSDYVQNKASAYLFLRRTTS